MKKEDETREAIDVGRMSLLWLLCCSLGIWRMEHENDIHILMRFVERLATTATSDINLGVNCYKSTTSEC